LRPFHPLFSNPHSLTVAASLWPRRLDTWRFPVERCLYPVEAGVEILLCSQRPSREPLGELLLVHGLEGSGEARYMRSLSQTALAAGYAASRFHIRGCCGRSNALYHAGLTSDLLSVLRQLARQGRAPVHLAGFSLGGNLVLKLAGELGHEAPALIASLAAISTPLDLAACSRRIGEPGNRLYERRFVSRMRRRLVAGGHATRSQLHPVNTVYDLDDQFTAPAFGFRDADHYYRTQSAIGFLDRIRVPTLLIQAQDDPLIPFQIFQDPRLTGNPSIRLLAPARGGHLGFLASRRPRFWADGEILDWIRNLRGACAVYY